MQYEGPTLILLRVGRCLRKAQEDDAWWRLRSRCSWWKQGDQAHKEAAYVRATDVKNAANCLQGAWCWRDGGQLRRAGCMGIKYG